MGNQRDTFAKRRREQARKDKARDKKERLAARRAEAQAAKHSPTASEDAAQAGSEGGQVGVGDPPDEAASLAVAASNDASTG